MIAYIIFNPDFYLIMVAAIALIKRLVLLSSTVLLIMISQLALSQDLSSPNLAADKDYQKTQVIIATTKQRIERARTETEARAQDIEALTTRVNELISNISSNSEDASSLRSELSVVNDLLLLERQTTKGLRKENKALETMIDNQKKVITTHKGLREKFSKLNTQHRRALRRLNLSIESAAQQKANNEHLERKLKRSNSEVRTLNREIKSLRKRLTGN